MAQFVRSLLHVIVQNCKYIIFLLIAEIEKPKLEDQRYWDYDHTIGQRTQTKRN